MGSSVECTPWLIRNSAACGGIGISGLVAGGASVAKEGFTMFFPEGAVTEFAATCSESEEIPDATEPADDGVLGITFAGLGGLGGGRGTASGSTAAKIAALLSSFLSLA